MLELGRHPGEMQEILSYARRWRAVARSAWSLCTILAVLIAVYAIYAVYAPASWFRFARTVATAPSAPPKDGPRQAQPHANWCSRTLRVQCGSGSGSAFMVTPTYALTNAHVVDCGQPLKLFRDDDQSSPIDARTVWNGTPNAGKDDLAILELATAAPDLVLPLGDSSSGQLPQGSDVFVAGYELGHKECALSRGILKSRRITQKLLVVDAAMNMGDSGGPTISPTQKAVVGVNVSQDNGVRPGNRVIAGINYAVDINYVRQTVPKAYLP